MSIHSKHGLVKKQGLTPEELAEIRQLANKCNEQEGLDLKLNWSILAQREQDQTNDFLYYEDGVLVGFLPLFNFNSTEAEISGMVHPAYRRSRGHRRRGAHFGRPLRRKTGNWTRLS